MMKIMRSPALSSFQLLPMYTSPSLQAGAKCRRGMPLSAGVSNSGGAEWVALEAQRACTRAGAAYLHHSWHPGQPATVSHEGVSGPRGSSGNSSRK